MNELCNQYRRNSRGWQYDYPTIVHPRIMVGSALGVDPLVFAKYKITHVVNCAHDIDSPNWFKNEYPHKYTYIGALDSAKEDITKWYPEFRESMNSFLVEPECNVIYVHCQCGINRSAFLTLIYVCLKFSYKLENVTKSMLIQRPCVFTNKVYQKQVVEYIKKHQE